MKTGSFLLFFWIFIVHTSFAQSVTFSQLPVDGQLYPRTQQSEGIIHIAGRVTGAGASRLSVVVTRNGSPFTHAYIPLFYTTPTTTYPFSTSLAIPAELAQFRVRVFMHRTSDSVLVADRQRIVAGDVYIINGQSNAVAYYSAPTYTYQSDYIRTFGIASSAASYNPADTLWATGNTTGSTVVGTWGMELCRHLIDQYGIPICVLNAGVGGAPIQLFNERNAVNPMDLTTNHGRLLYRVNRAGLAGSVKAYFFRQGENETSGASSAWPTRFDVLFQNIRTDYPTLGRFYLFQIHVLAGTNEQTGVFRDYQRKLGTVQPLIQPYATVGTVTYDGIHFGVEGHLQTGREVFRMVARDFYRSTDTAQITSPDIKKVYYTSASRNELVMQFDEDQHMVWPSDTTLNDTYGNQLTHQMRQWLYLDKLNGLVTAGRVDGYRVILSLSQSVNAQQLGYLPPNYPNVEGWQPFPAGYAAAFPGPFLTNKRGLRALTFWNVPISAALSSLIGFTVNGANNTVSLTWTDHPGEQAYILERRRANEPTFSRLVTLPANTTTYTDSSAQQSGEYRYRLRAVTATAEATADGTLQFSCQTGQLSLCIRPGNWQQPYIWQCENLPSATSQVQIATNQTVTVTQPVTANKIRLQGTLSIQSGGSLRVGTL